MAKQHTLTVQIEPDGRLVKVVGREAWTLDLLIKAGQQGITPITHPGPRLSHYVFKLRGCGLIIETIDETHGGPFPGRHGRYVLRTSVTIVDPLERGVAA